MAAQAHPSAVFELETARRRLDYYTQQKSKSPKNKTLDKWIEIYEERVQKLQRQVSRLGLRTQLDTASSSSRSASH